MAKTKDGEEGVEGVTVVLHCIYSGPDYAPGPGETITLDAAEAERLIALGAARLVSAEAAPEAGV